MGVTKEEVKERIADTNGFLKGLFSFGIISKSSPVFGMLNEIILKNQDFYDRVDKEGFAEK